MRIFSVSGGEVHTEPDWPERLPDQGYVWIACTREQFQTNLSPIQSHLERLTGQSLVDLHVSDLLNAQLPSRFDYSSHYDLVVFRRLAHRQDTASPADAHMPSRPSKRTGPPVLHRIDTSPVGFGVFDRVLLSVHPTDCAVRDAYAQRLLASSALSRSASATVHEATDPRSTGARGVPSSLSELVEHDCLVFTTSGARWEFQSAQGVMGVDVRPKLKTNDGAALYRATADGLGIAVLADYLALPALDSGLLVPVLPQLRLPDIWLKALVPANRVDLPRISSLLQWLKLRLTAIEPISISALLGFKIDP